MIATGWYKWEITVPSSCSLGALGWVPPDLSTLLLFISAGCQKAFPLAFQVVAAPQPGLLPPMSGGHCGFSFRWRKWTVEAWLFTDVLLAWIGKHHSSEMKKMLATVRYMGKGKNIAGSNPFTSVHLTYMRSEITAGVFGHVSSSISLCRPSQCNPILSPRTWQGIPLGSDSLSITN